MKNYDLDRFKKAHALMFERALSELRAGKKRSHWMWYIFPQLRALGHSSTAGYYGIADIGEAKAYIADLTLREHLLSAAQALLALDGSDPRAVMGEIDALKLASSMTLFEVAAPDIPEFSCVLEKYYGGKRDATTLALLEIK